MEGTLLCRNGIHSSHCPPDTGIHRREIQHRGFIVIVLGIIEKAFGDLQHHRGSGAVEVCHFAGAVHIDRLDLAAQFHIAAISEHTAMILLMLLTQ